MQAKRGETLDKEICRELPHIENASAEVAFCARDKTRALPTDLIDITTLTCMYCRGRIVVAVTVWVAGVVEVEVGGGRGDGTSGGMSAVVVAAIIVAQH